MLSLGFRLRFILEVGQEEPVLIEILDAKEFILGTISSVMKEKEIAIVGGECVKYF